jgi:glycosyltransferase involved in cell wall biosynthesis
VTPRFDGVEAFAVQPISALGKRLDRGDFDAALYQLGNNPDFHAAIHRTLLAHPGVVVMHEYMLHHMIRELTLVQGDVAAYLEEHRYCYGRAGYEMARGLLAAGLPVDVWSHPLFERVVDRSLGVIVHSEHVRRRILTSRAGARVEVIPHHLDLSALPAAGPEAERAARRRLGLAEDALVVASYGFITPAKRLETALAAFARLRRDHPQAVVLLVGEVSPYYDLGTLLAGGLEEAVVVTGRLGKERFLEAMTAADIALNLRHPTGGETSGTCIRLLGLGKAVVVNDAGWFAEIPEGCAAKVAVDEREPEMLAAVLSALAGDPELRRRMGENARRHMEAHHTLEGSASRYAGFAAERAAAPRPAPPVPPLAPYPREDVFTHVVADAAAAAADLGAVEGDDALLGRLAGRLAELDLDVAEQVSPELRPPRRRW